MAEGECQGRSLPRKYGLPDDRCSEAIEGTPGAAAAVAEHMGVNHGGGHVVVAEEFLDGANVGAALEKSGGEAVAKGVAAGFAAPCSRPGFFKCAKSLLGMARAQRTDIPCSLRALFRLLKSNWSACGSI